MMRQSSKPCTGSAVGIAPPLSRWADYLPGYPLRLVGHFLATLNWVGVSYLIFLVRMAG
jgi:hypothetical protein